MTEKEYEALCDMFLSEGWEIFMKGITDLEETVVQVAPDHANTNDKWQYARGKIHQLRVIMGYEDYTKLSWEQSLEDLKLFHNEDDIDVDVV